MQPAFDGLRGVAVLAVLAAHVGEFMFPATEDWPLRGGFLGVDVFFVLSGFLITGLLVAELERRGGIRTGRFYARRVTRLVPALVGLLAAHWVYTLVQGFATGPEGTATLYALTFTSNWQATWGVQPAIDVPIDLSHLWSLGVEAQFYLVWPPLLWALWRWVRSARAQIAIVASAIAALAAVRAIEFGSFDAWPLVYTRFDARGDSLLVGALLALLVAHGLFPGRRALRGLALAGGAGLVAALVLLEPSTDLLYWGVFTAVALAAAAIVALTLEPTGRLARALAWSPIRSVGLASYSIYLWHLPVFLWAVRVVPTPNAGRVLLALAVTGVTSTASYWLLERPYLRRRGRITPAHVGLKPLPEAATVPTGRA